MPDIFVNRNDKKIRLLFVASLFEEKGGPLVLALFDKLSLKYSNLELWIKSDVPERFKQKYPFKNINFFEFKNKIMLRDELLEKIYARCDIFIYPTLVDSFGGALLDAMCCKLPIVTTNIYAVPEIVQNNKNGFVIDVGGSPKYRSVFPGENDAISEEEYMQYISSKLDDKTIFNNFYNALIKLIENRALRVRMGLSGYKEVKEGKFSLKKRNLQLMEVYQKALR